MLFIDDPQTAQRYCDLTPRQREYVQWIARFIHEHGYPPTVREMARGLGGGGWPNAGAGMIAVLCRAGLASLEPCPEEWRASPRTLTLLGGIRWEPMRCEVRT